MKNNIELRADVINAIKWEPLLHAAHIGVTAKDGVVSLTGEVDSYTKKMEAENATKKVIGVKAVIEKIEVKILSKWATTDSEVIRKIFKSLKKTWSLQKDKINVKVENGWITLGGEFHWNYQRDAAIKAVQHLYGVRGVTNNIKIKSEFSDDIDQKDIEKALRISTIDNSEININVSGTTITLSGKVNSWYQRDEVERITWKTPGICHLNNELEIDYYYSLVS
jgi:osmotically-inducible protein OsmY